MKKPPLEELFERFWRLYPVKRNKRAARAQWDKVVGADEVLALRLVADVERRLAADEHWLRGFVVYAQRYLRDHRWEDELAPAAAGVGRTAVENARVTAAAARALIARRSGG